MENNKKQFIYVLKPIPRLLNEANWTKAEEAITGEHSAHLEKLKGEGRLILAGKTEGLNEKTFGIVIFEADSMDEARTLMEQDPGIAEGIMTAELYPYHVALIRS